jgi:hypothetical protein
VLLTGPSIGSDSKLRLSTAVQVTVSLALAVSATVGCSADRESAKASQNESSDLPPSKVNDAMLDCMKSVGWEGEMERGGGMSFGSIPAEQMSQYEQQSAKCKEKTGWGNLAVLTSDQRQTMFDLEVKEYQCLKDLGFSPAEPPTEQTYLDTFDSADQYFAVRDMVLTVEQTNECPPPTWFMNW